MATFLLRGRAALLRRSATARAPRASLSALTAPHGAEPTAATAGSSKDAQGYVPYNWEDPLDLRGQLSEDECAYADAARKPAMMLGMGVIILSDMGTAFSTSLVPLALARLGLGGA